MPDLLGLLRSPGPCIRSKNYQLRLGMTVVGFKVAQGGKCLELGSFLFRNNRGSDDTSVINHMSWIRDQTPHQHTSSERAK